MIAYLTLLILFLVLVVLWVVVLFNVGTRYTTTWVALIFGTLYLIVYVVLSVAYASIN